MVTAITTRTIGIDAPPAIRNMVCSGERVDRSNASSKTLGPLVEVVTLAETRASITSLDTGSGTAGPMNSSRLIASGTGGAPGYARRRHGQGRARPGDELLGVEPIGIAQAPNLGGVAEHR